MNAIHSFTDLFYFIKLEMLVKGVKKFLDEFLLILFATLSCGKGSCL